MVRRLGYNVPKVLTLIFWIGCGLSGVIGGNCFITDPAMAARIGPIVWPAAGFVDAKIRS